MRNHSRTSRHNEVHDIEPWEPAIFLVLADNAILILMHGMSRQLLAAVTRGLQQVASRSLGVTRGAQLCSHHFVLFVPSLILNNSDSLFACFQLLRCAHAGASLSVQRATFSSNQTTAAPAGTTHPHSYIFASNSRLIQFPLGLPTRVARPSAAG
jgi:hypothetical protein